MKWSETTANKCRYGDVAEKIWGNWEILWEDSEDNYQGHATILAHRGNRYCFYEWWYGSCSGCDGWESDGLTDEQIEKEMRDTSMWFKNKKELLRWLGMLEGNPISNYNMDRGGALVQGIDFLGGGIFDRINAIRAHFGIPPYKSPNVEAKDE